MQSVPQIKVIKTVCDKFQKVYNEVRILAEGNTYTLRESPLLKNCGALICNRRDKLGSDIDWVTSDVAVTPLN